MNKEKKEGKEYQTGEQGMKIRLVAATVGTRRGVSGCRDMPGACPVKQKSQKIV